MWAINELRSTNVQNLPAALPLSLRSKKSQLDGRINHIEVLGSEKGPAILFYFFWRCKTIQQNCFSWTFAFITEAYGITLDLIGEAVSFQWSDAAYSTFFC